MTALYCCLPNSFCQPPRHCSAPPCLELVQLRSRTELDHPDVAGKAVVDLELQGSRSR